MKGSSARDRFDDPRLLAQLLVELARRPAGVAGEHAQPAARDVLPFGVEQAERSRHRRAGLVGVSKSPRASTAVGPDGPARVDTTSSGSASVGQLRARRRPPRSRWGGSAPRPSRPRRCARAPAPRCAGSSRSAAARRSAAVRAWSPSRHGALLATLPHRVALLREGGGALARVLRDRTPARRSRPGAATSRPRTSRATRPGSAWRRRAPAARSSRSPRPARGRRRARRPARPPGSPAPASAPRSAEIGSPVSASSIATW